MTWVPIPAGSDFPIDNLPYGIFSEADATGTARVGVAIGDHVLDACRLDLPFAADLAQPTLNPFMARGFEAWAAVRERLVELLTDESHRPAVAPHLLPRAGVTLRMPFAVADFVDFYSSEDHATNLGRLFRPDSPPLLPNWKHLPVGYHGRAGTVVVSGTPIRRPSGQRKAADSPTPTFGPSTRLDIEAELGFVVGAPSAHGTPVSTSDFGRHVFGVVLVNDWSARDLQAWEYVPLGPFLGKSFATSISAWVVPMAALAAARINPPVQEPEPLPYLRVGERWGLDIELEVEWNGTIVSRPPASRLYWTGPQQLAHLTANGASLRTGDLFATGTISGPDRTQRGSFIELCWNGTQPITLADGSERIMLADGDVVTLRASAPGVHANRIGWGELSGAVLPAADPD